ncbi:DEAD/DEAH box helicase [Mucilaginibacter terrenus]|uniref:DEAD/DEAH box helicase n=1 Tax=Mucilaginibacter terrenus TaxID=2482727 RepID=A0A3E2NYD2_9SPHI|nr:DEAD/DEAH box helicase [Mucilaginibacter terrenus]
MWSDKLRLNKQLIRSVKEVGYTSPTELQLKTINRIIGGQDLIAIAPEGCGKTTTIVLGALNRFSYKPDGVPQVLILVPDQEAVFAMIAHFDLLNKNSAIRIVGLHTGGGVDQQMDDLAEGADIVIASPERARAIYLKLGLNLNKVTLFIIDDAHEIVKLGLQLPVTELSNSIDKCQRLVFSEVMHDKLERMIMPFMNTPAEIEVDGSFDQKIPTYQQLLYHVPNFGTKLNLLTLFMQDDELFTKTVVFANTKQTAEKIYQQLQNRQRTTVMLLAPAAFELKQVSAISEFTEDESARVLIIANENEQETDLTNIPFIIHFDLPADKDTFIKHVTKATDSNDDDTVAITFATDIELNQVRKIEQATGQKMEAGELPEDLVIEKDHKQKEAEKEKKPVRVDPNKHVPGEAFHTKKPENAKTFNFSSGEKAKMNKKRKH